MNNNTTNAKRLWILNEISRASIMSSKEILMLNENLDSDTDDTGQLIDLIGKLKPKWKSGDVNMKILGGGFINKIWKCTHNNESIIVRIHPKVERMPGTNRELEFIYMKVLAEKGLIAPLLARFSNGMVYDYSNGDIFTNYSIMYDSHIKELILQKLQQIIHIPLGEFGNPDLGMKDNIWYKWLRLFSEEVTTVYEDPEQQKRFDEEVSWIFQKEIKKYLGLMVLLFQNYPLKFCHHDLWWSNLVYDKQKDQIHFIDWEMAGPGIEPMEIAIIVTDWTGSYETDDETEEKFQKDWIKSYLMTKPDPDFVHVGDALVEKWYIDVLKSIAITFIGAVVWCFWILKLAKSDEEFKLFFSEGCRYIKRFIKVDKKLKELIKF